MYGMIDGLAGRRKGGMQIVNFVTESFVVMDGTDTNRQQYLNSFRN